MTDWIETDIELPPCDGLYEVTNHPEFEKKPSKEELFSIAFYDGYGFKYLGIYRNPKWWRKNSERMKRYGKINKDDY